MDLTPYLDAAWKARTKLELDRALERNAKDGSWEGEVATCELLLAETDEQILAAAKRLRAEERRHFHEWPRNRESATDAWARDQEDAA